jgi:S-adenosylmethionine:tRNA ribosyltransferase-isomerase
MSHALKNRQIAMNQTRTNALGDGGLSGLRTRDFDYQLPEELIAQVPCHTRDESRLLVYDRASGRIDHLVFRQVTGQLRRGDVLVVNDSRVIPARLFGIKTATGARLEILLLEETQPDQWWAMLRPGKRAPLGTILQIVNINNDITDIECQVVNKNNSGYYQLRFSPVGALGQRLDELGSVPLPPYINRPQPGGDTVDRERYQTVYARPPGSVAAPTAGLHFTGPLLQELKDQGIIICPVTLHVGAGTFAPVKAERVCDHRMHEERFELPSATAEAIEQARREQRRIIAVGTTAVRVLESVAAENQGRLAPGFGRTRIFIYPPYRFKVVTGLITNFHLPQSTLLMLVSAFASPSSERGRELLLSVYAEAVRLNYRFFSYGDAMLLF